MKRALIALTLLAVLTACAKPETETERNRRIVTEFARAFYADKDVERAFRTYVAKDYVQHNPGIADGREAAIAALAPMFATKGAMFEVKRILVDGDMAMIHLFGRGDPNGPGAAVADLYRLKDGKIIEHWDVIQPIADTSINPHPFF